MIMTTELEAQTLVMIFSYLAIGLAVTAAVIAAILRIKRGST